MIPEWLTALASVGTFLVVAITAFAALRQIRHMRSGNQVAALLPLIEKYEATRESRDYVMRSLQLDLNDRTVRAGVMAVPAEGPARQAIPFLNFYESVGALVAVEVLDLDLVLRYFFPTPSEVWANASGFIAISRRTSGPEIFENLEALVVMQEDYERRHGTSVYPRGLRHLDPPDRWRSDDD